MKVYQNEKIIDSSAYVTAKTRLLLPDNYVKNGYKFELVKREGIVCIYSQKSKGKVIAYEVFIISQRKERELFGRKVEAKESVPVTSEWGINAFTCTNLENALKRFTELKSKIVLRDNKT